MPDLSTLLFFTAASLALLITPGPAVLYIVSCSMDRGRRAGLISVLGLTAGGMIHVIAAAVGLSAVVAASATAFNTIRYAGAAYLIYLGIRRLLEPAVVSGAGTPVPEASAGRLFRRGFLVNLLNPKPAIFFLAFFPQFIDPARGSPTVQILVLGAVFGTLALISDGAYALAAGTIGDRLRRSRRFAVVQKYVTGGVYVGLGMLTAVGGGRKQ